MIDEGIAQCRSRASAGSADRCVWTGAGGFAQERSVRGMRIHQDPDAKRTSRIPGAVNQGALGRRISANTSSAGSVTRGKVRSSMPPAGVIT